MRGTTYLLVVAILVVISAIVYTTVFNQFESFTAFYILNANGKAENYPTLLTVNEKAEILAGIDNQERKTITYRIETRINGILDSQTQPISVEHNTKWEEVINFTLGKIGSNQKVEFLLYKQGQKEVCQVCYLWVSTQPIGEIRKGNE